MIVLDQDDLGDRMSLFQAGGNADRLGPTVIRNGLARDDVERRLGFGHRFGLSFRSREIISSGD